MNSNENQPAHPVLSLITKWTGILNARNGISWGEHDAGKNEQLAECLAELKSASLSEPKEREETPLIGKLRVFFEQIRNTGCMSNSMKAWQMCLKSADDALAVLGTKPLSAPEQSPLLGQTELTLVHQLAGEGCVYGDGHDSDDCGTPTCWGCRARSILKARLSEHVTESSHAPSVSSPDSSSPASVATEREDNDIVREALLEFADWWRADQGNLADSGRVLSKIILAAIQKRCPQCRRKWRGGKMCPNCDCKLVPSAQPVASEQSTHVLQMEREEPSHFANWYALHGIPLGIGRENARLIYDSARGLLCSDCACAPINPGGECPFCGKLFSFETPAAKTDTERLDRLERVYLDSEWNAIFRESVSFKETIRERIDAMSPDTEQQQEGQQLNTEPLTATNMG